MNPIKRDPTPPPEERPSSQEIDETALFAKQVAYEILGITYNAQERSLSASRFIQRGTESATLLRAMPELVPYRKVETCQLKAEVLNSWIRFKPEKVEACVAHYAKPLSQDKRKELVRVAVNTVATPLAAISRVIKVTLKAVYLHSVDRMCMMDDPEHFGQCVKRVRDTFEGRNPEANRRLKESIPHWVSEALSYIQKGEEALHRLDDYMVQEFRTTPGIVQEGVHGLFDVGPVKCATLSAKVVGTPLVVAGTLILPKSLIRTQAIIKPWDHLPNLRMSESMLRFDLKSIERGLSRRFTPSELKERVLSVKEGRIYRGSSPEPLTTNDTMNIVMMRDGKLLADYGEQADGLFTYHSALAQEPIAAGQMKTLAGRLSYLDEKSGHFLPYDRIHFIEHQLRSLGAEMTGDYYLHAYDKLRKMF